MNINRVIFGGRVVARPELKSTQGGTQVAHFTIVSNERHGDKEFPCFLDVTCFGRLADNCARYLDKGREAIAIGTLRQDNWTGKDGQKHTKVQIFAEEVQFLGGGQRNDGAQTMQYAPPAQSAPPQYLTEEEMLDSIRYPMR